LIQVIKKFILLLLLLCVFFSVIGSIDPYRMYSGIQCGRSLAANRPGFNQNESSANERLQKSSKGCAVCQT
jgi:hypothetical protein